MWNDKDAELEDLKKICPFDVFIQFPPPNFPYLVYEETGIFCKLKTKWIKEKSFTHTC